MLVLSIKPCVLKFCSGFYFRGNPSTQCSAILALSGLAQATQSYVSSMDNEELKIANEIKEFRSHSHWLMSVIDSCMSLVDFTYQPKAELIGLCQQVNFCILKLLQIFFHLNFTFHTQCFVFFFHLQNLYM